MISATPLLTATILLVFLAITFLQSAWDKVSDWKGNTDWLRSHFKDTPFRNVVPVLVACLTVMEWASGLMAVAGAGFLWVSGNAQWALAAAGLSCVTLLMLLLGQRVAKDYDGARTIVIYLMPAVFLLLLLELQ